MREKQIFKAIHFSNHITCKWSAHPIKTDVRMAQKTKAQLSAASEKPTLCLDTNSIKEKG